MLPRFAFRSLVVFSWLITCPWLAEAQPFRHAHSTPSPEVESALRQPVAPSQLWLGSVAKDPEHAMAPSFGGLDKQGMPVWTNQVQRRQFNDTTLAFTGWVKRGQMDPQQNWKNFLEKGDGLGEADWGPGLRACYQRFENGWLEEQVSFHSNGQALHHLHKNAHGQNTGSQRMWHRDGQMQSDRFYDPQGRMHGTQWQWKPDGQLEWSRRFEHGIELDKEGQPIPEDKRLPFFSGDGC